MSNITEEDVMEYCYSRNLMLVTKESLEYMYRPIVIETMNKNTIPIEWINKFRNQFETTDDYYNVIDYMLQLWEKENG